MTNTVYGNAWEDLSGLGEQYVENNQGWENVAGGITTVNWFKYLHYAPYYRHYRYQYDGDSFRMTDRSQSFLKRKSLDKTEE
jgi:hypothetical protein